MKSHASRAHYGPVIVCGDAEKRRFILARSRIHRLCFLILVSRRSGGWSFILWRRLRQAGEKGFSHSFLTRRSRRRRYAMPATLIFQVIFYDGGRFPHARFLVERRSGGWRSYFMATAPASGRKRIFALLLDAPWPAKAVAERSRTFLSSSAVHPESARLGKPVFSIF